MSYPVFYPVEDDTLPIFWGSYDGGDGSSITMTGLLASDIEIYKDGGVTQRSSDSGYTLLDTDGTDFDGITGLHGISIDLSDNTDAGFFTVGPWYTVVISSVTVDAQVVSFVAAQFRIDAAPALASVCTEVRLAELDAANLPTDVDAILVDTAVIGAAGVGLTAVGLAATGLDLVLPAEPAAVPAWGVATAKEWLAWIGMFFRNKQTQTAAVLAVRDDADAVDIATSATSDDGTTFTRGELT